MQRASVYARQSSNRAKSIKEQLIEGHRAIVEEGWQHAGDYKDGTSASRYATKPRGGWEQVLQDVAEQSLDILILWESSRGDRTPESWFAFLSSCRDNGVRIHIITHERTYNPRNARDWKSLAEDGVNNAYESELLSIRTSRGQAGAAVAGLPAGGPTPYGYKRTFDPDTGKRVGQVIKEPEASVVREIFARLAKGHNVLTIAMDLNRRAVPAAAAKHWLPAAIRRIARNKAYLGIRVHKDAEYQGQWEPIITEAEFYTVRRFLDSPARQVIARPAKQVHLLSYLAKCGVCDEFMYASIGAYKCLIGCVSLMESEMDEVVTQAVVARLAQPDALNVMFRGDEREAAQAEVAAQKLREELEGWRQSAINGETSPASLAAIEKGLTERIAVLDETARTAGLPLVVKEMLEIDDWGAATLAMRRETIRSLCEVRVGRGIAGRASSIVRRDRTYHRLGGSRWVGDSLTWADHWAAAGLNGS